MWAIVSSCCLATAPLPHSAIALHINASLHQLAQIADIAADHIHRQLATGHCSIKRIAVGIATDHTHPVATQVADRCPVNHPPGQIGQTKRAAANRGAELAAAFCIVGLVFRKIAIQARSMANAIANGARPRQPDHFQPIPGLRQHLAQHGGAAALPRQAGSGKGGPVAGGQPDHRAGIRHRRRGQNAARPEYAKPDYPVDAVVERHWCSPG